jgi:putative membrane protein
MKKIALPLFVMTMLLGVACNNAGKKDSTEVAEEKNEQKMDSTKTEKMEDDHEFMVEAASGGLMEVQLGEYGSQNAASPKVKEFAQRMVKDHSKANEELKTLAAQKNITIPATPGEKHQKHIDNLKAKKGADFDKDYISMMVDDHKEDIEHFEKEAKDGKDPAIKTFASSILPILKQHLQMAQTIHDGMKK